MPSDPSTTATLLIEYQNEFTSEGGILHEAVKGVDGRDEHARQHRERGGGRGAEQTIATIMHAPITLAPSYGELPERAVEHGILKGVVDGNAFIKGSWGTAIVDALTPPAEGDILIEGKRQLDPFASANIKLILRSKGIKTLILGGFLTNCCVESTMRTAYEHGFEVVTLVDCVAGVLDGRAPQRDPVQTSPCSSRPMPSAELTSSLQGGEMAEDSSRGY